VNWNLSAREIYNWFRATVEWPRLFTVWSRANKQELRLILGDILPLSDNFEEIIDSDYTLPEVVPPILMDAKLDNLNIIKLAENKADRASKKSHAKNIDPKIKKTAKQQYAKVEHKSVRPDWWQVGVVVKASGNDLIVAAADGLVKISKIQPAGKRMMTTSEFLAGYRIECGEKFSGIKSIH
jgi:methionyl-tRNA formyltransferase